MKWNLHDGYLQHEVVLYLLKQDVALDKEIQYANKDLQVLFGRHNFMVAADSAIVLFELYAQRN